MMEQAILYALMALCCLFGSTVQSTTGFGFGVIVMSLLPFFLPYGLSLAISNALGLTSSALMAVRFRKKANWRIMRPLIPSFFLCNSLTVWLSGSQSDTVLRKVLGVFLVLLGIYFAFFSEKLKIRATVKNGLLAGSIGGVMSGLFGMGGPPVVLYMVSACDSDEEYMASIQSYFVISNSYALLNRILNGHVTLELIPHYFIGIFALVVGVRLGIYLFLKVNSGNLKKLIYGVITLSGVMLFLR